MLLNKCYCLLGLPQTFYSIVDDDVTKPFGPHEGGHFLFLYGKLGIDGDYTDQVGRLESPTYRDSASECRISFSHYINGDLVSAKKLSLASWVSFLIDPDTRIF